MSLAAGENRGALLGDRWACQAGILWGSVSADPERLVSGADRASGGNKQKTREQETKMSDKRKLGNSGEIPSPEPEDGFSVWIESGVWYIAPTVPDDFGGHDYDNGGFEKGVRDCKCGCFMTRSSSGGEVDPFGRCPENLKPTTKKNECVWEEEEGTDTSGDYQTSCDKMFTIMEGNPKNNGFKYCPYCGGKLKEK